MNWILSNVLSFRDWSKASAALAYFLGIHSWFPEPFLTRACCPVSFLAFPQLPPSCQTQFPGIAPSHWNAQKTPSLSTRQPQPPNSCSPLFPFPQSVSCVCWVLSSGSAAQSCCPGTGKRSPREPTSQEDVFNYQQHVDTARASVSSAVRLPQELACTGAGPVCHFLL